MSNINTPCLYLKLDTVVSNKVFDSAGNLLVGNATSTSLVNDPTFGSCLGFNGSTSHVNVSNLYQGRAFPPTQGVYTASVWVYPKAYQAGPDNEMANTFFDLKLGNSVLLQMALSSTGELKLNFNGGEMVTLMIELSLNTWYFVGVSVNGSQVQVALNGEKLPPFPLSSSALAPTTTNQLILGSDGGSFYFNGNLAHARVYTESLSAAEMGQVMAADLAGGLLLHLPLAESSSTSTPNYSLYPSYTAAPINNPTLEASDQFGTTMHFNGTNQYVALNGLVCSNTRPWTAVTIESWVKVSLAQNGAILSYDPYNFFELGVTATGGVVNVTWTTVDTNNVKDVMSGTKNIADGQWHFITVVYRAGDGLKEIYMDGIIDVSQQGAHAGLCIGTSVSNTTRYGAVGLSGRAFSYNAFNPTYSHFAGNLCQVKLYSSALTQADIQRDMGASLIASYSFWKGYPLLFFLQEENMDNTIYIYESPEGHSVDLVFLNTTSASQLYFDALTSAGPNNYQFAVSFRPGVLSQATLADIGLANAGWRMSAPTVMGDGSVTLYISASSPFTLQPMQQLRLTLTAMSADPQGGSRGTRVQTLYRNITYLDSQSPLSGNVSASVNIVNHEGSSEMPLMAAFNATDTVYNGDQNFANSLQLRITNIQSPAGGGGAIAFKGGQTQLVLVFQGATTITSGDPGPMNTWDVIGTYGVVMNPSMKGGVPWNVATVFHGGSEYYWTLTPQADFTLMPGDQLQIDLTNLKVQATAGYSNVYLSYENLPSFWDGKMTLQVMKSKVFSTGAKLGIGTGTPVVPLQVKGGSNASVGTANSGYTLLGSSTGTHLALGNTAIAAKNSGTTAGPMQLYATQLTIGADALITGTATVQTGNLTLSSANDNLISFSNAQLQYKSGLVADNSGNLYIRTGGNSTSNNRLTLSSAGNWGINGASVSTAQLMLTGSQTVNTTTATATGLLVLGSPSGGQLALDASTIMAKSSPTQMGNLYLRGDRISLLASYPATVANGVDLQYGSVSKLKVDNNGITAVSGTRVVGIPVWEVKTITLTISSGTGSAGRSASGTVIFSSPPAAQPVTMMQYWKVRYTGNHDHEIQMIWVNTSVTLWSGSSTSVTVQANIMLTDEPGDDGNDPYEGVVTVVVMARLSGAVSY